MESQPINQRIHQTQAAYVPEEDRLLFKINTQHREEFRFWMTRRFIKRFWPALSQALKNHPDIAMPSSPESRNAILDFMQENASSQADFSTEFAPDPAVTPLGSAPVLISQARIRAGGGSGFLVSFHPTEGYGIEVAMDAQLLFSFRQLLSDAISQADWDLSTKKPTAARKDPLEALAVPRVKKTRQLH